MFCIQWVHLFSFQVIGIRLIHRLVRSDSNMPFLRFLYQHNCDLNAGTLLEKFIPIGIAIVQKQSEILKFLIQNGADVNKCIVGPWNKKLLTPIDVAVMDGSAEMLKILLTAEGLDINQTNKPRARQEKPVLLECVMHYHESVKVLLEAGADPNICGIEEDTPLSAATRLRNYDLMKLLIEYGADPNYPQRNNRLCPIPLQHSVLTGKRFCLFLVAIHMSCLNLVSFHITVSYRCLFQLKFKFTKLYYL